MEVHDTQQMLNVLKDLIWLNGVIATELIQITENTSAAIRGEIPQSCKIEHSKLREQAIEIVSRYCPEKVHNLKDHILKHS
ncbi:MAG: hypothetical protein QMD66_04165 [Actinomycetota bacterium]|nr:hypothetical protein [Actinomycetota bacterium]MDI6822048.1 hypothetical protein [Actinomycetota bacterium]